MSLRSITGKVAFCLVVTMASLQFSASGLAMELRPAASPLAQKQQAYAALPPPSAPGLSREPFDEAAVPVASGDVAERWRVIQTEIDADTAVLDRCRARQECTAAARALLDIIAQGRDHEGLARVGRINQAVNLAIVPTSDLRQWGVSDHWSAPLETLTSRRGDCEDYAIAKYVALIEAGVAKADVELVIVHNHLPQEDHAVVAARVAGAWLILDNRSHALVPPGKLRGATPLFVLDATGARIFVPGIAGNWLS
jgi:predicted transglutaminase-like cysteine proteinase